MAEAEVLEPSGRQPVSSIDSRSPACSIVSPGSTPPAGISQPQVSVMKRWRQSRRTPRSGSCHDHADRRPRHPYDVVLEARPVGQLDVRQAHGQAIARVDRSLAVNAPARHARPYSASAFSRRIARPASHPLRSAAAPRPAPRRAPLATTSLPGSTAPACAPRRTRRGASRTARARAPRAAHRPDARRAGSSTRGRSRRCRRRARASPPRARTGSSAAARTVSRESARSAASGTPGRRAAGSRSESPKPQWTCTGSGRPVASLRLPARRRPAPDDVVEAAAVGGDRLQRRRSRRRARRQPRRRRRVLQAPSAAPAARAQPASSPSSRHSMPGPGRREAVVDEQQLRPRRAQQRRRVLVRLGRQPVRRRPPARSARTPKCAASSRIARRYVTPRRDVRPLARVGLSENRPRNSSSVAGGPRRMPCAWWSTRPTALSTSGSDPAARISRPPPSRPSHSERRTARYDPVSTGPSARSAPRRPRARRAPPPASPGRRTMPRRSRSSSGDRRRIDLDRLRRLEPALEPVEPGRDQPADREVGIAARVGRLQLDVRRRLLHPGEDRRHADRRLAVVVSPARERAGPVLGDDAVVRVEARRRQAAQRRAGARGRRRGTSAPRARGGRRAAASWKRLRSPSQSEKWMCPPLPAPSGHGFGASDATSPCCAATPRIVSRTSSCSSAARSAGACAVEISCWPWPSSA